MKTRGRKIFGTALVAAFVVAAVFATAVSAATAAEKGAAGNWTEWEYSKSVLVKENSGQTLTDYQVLLNLSGADFPAEAKLDGSDLRFVDAGSGEELSYWVEKFDAANETGRVWVKVPEIPADGEAEFKMLFGNPSAESTSNGSAVFELFDVSGIVAFWHLDEDSWSGEAGEVKDETGENDGTAKNGANTTAEGRFKRAGSFDGSDDFVDCGNDESLDITDEITIEAWVKRGNITTGLRDIVTKYSYGKKSFYTALDEESKIVFCHTQDNTYDTYHWLYGNTSIDTNWHHLVFIFDYGYKVYYLDGTEMESNVSEFTSMYSSNELVRIGKNGHGGETTPFNGTIDEVRIYNRALSAEEIATIYKNYTEKMGSYYNVRKYADPEPTVKIGEEEPTEAVSTDKTTYSTGETMKVEIGIANPSATKQSVVFRWWLTIPSFDYLTVPITTMPMTLPAGYDETFKYPIYVGYWGEQSFGAVWGVALSDPTTSEILSFDATYWNYEPRETETTKAKKSQVSLANEIKEAVEIGGKSAKRASSA